MDTKFRDIQPVVAQGLVLSTLGVLLTTAITGMLIFYLSEWTNLDIGLTLPMSMLLAATVSSTDSASVFNLLRSQHIGLKHNLRPTLELESGSNAPMAYVLTIALVEAIVSADTLSGMDLASKIVMFLTLGLLADPSDMLGVLLVAVAIGLFMMFVARPVAVFLCLQPFRVPFRAKVFLSWVGLRGAVPIIFATYPVIAGIEDAHFLFNVVFVITLLSLSIQGTTITACARWLGLATDEPKEGNEFGVELPEELGSRLSEMTITDETLAGGNDGDDRFFRISRTADAGAGHLSDYGC